MTSLWYSPTCKSNFAVTTVTITGNGYYVAGCTQYA